MNSPTIVHLTMLFFCFLVVCEQVAYNGACGTVHTRVLASVTFIFLLNRLHYYTSTSCWGIVSFDMKIQAPARGADGSSDSKGNFQGCAGCAQPWCSTQWTIQWVAGLLCYWGLRFVIDQTKHGSQKCSSPKASFHCMQLSMEKVAFSSLQLYHCCNLTCLLSVPSALLLSVTSTPPRLLSPSQHGRTLCCGCHNKSLVESEVWIWTRISQVFFFEQKVGLSIGPQ